jgi:undecaprenyl-diphosphatase
MNPGELDTLFFLFINKTLHLPVLDPVMIFITTKSFFVVAPVFLLIFLRDKKKSLFILLVAVSSVALADWAAYALKGVFLRPRPFMSLEGINLLVPQGKSFSMPSNHAVNIFAFVAPFYFMTKDRLKHILLLIAVLVALSRVYVGVHYPSDVAAGAILGIGVASAVAAFYALAFKKERHLAFLIIFLTFLSVFRIYYILNGPIDLGPDEAHYWEWSRRLDISYYSKGPAIAYLIWSGTALFGDTVMGVRVLAVVFSLLSSIALYRLGTYLYDEEVGAYAASLFQIIPLFSAFGVIMTIDSPFIFFWILSLLFFWRAVSTDDIAEWCLLGIFVGLGLLTKYTMAFFYLCAFLFLITSYEYRKNLLRPGPYLGLLISLMVFSPVIYWNWRHGWVTLRHTIGQTHLKEGLVISLPGIGEFIGSQFGVITPILLVMIIYALIKLRKEDSFSLWFSAPVLAFFLLKSIQGKVQANWAMTGYLTGLIAFSARYLKDLGKARTVEKALVGSAIALSLIVSAAAYYPAYFGIPPALDPSSRLRGWNALGQEVSLIREGMGERVFVFSDSYRVSSELAFYVKGKPITYCANTGRRMNQYDLWPGFEGLMHYNAVFVKIDDSDMPAELKEAFKSCGKRLFTVYNDKKGTEGVKLRDYSIFLCYDFKGMGKRPPESY